MCAKLTRSAVVVVLSTTHKTLLICGFGQYFGKLTTLNYTTRVFSLSADINEVRNVLITPKYRVMESREVGSRGHLQPTGLLWIVTKQPVNNMATDGQVTPMFTSVFTFLLKIIY